MTPPNNTETNDPAWAKNNGETISATNNNETQRVETISWPRNATPKHELNPDQIEVIEQAVLNPNITNIAKLNREKCSYKKNHSDTYANQVLSAHWPERLNTNFDSTNIETVDSTDEQNTDVENGIGGISLIGENNNTEQTNKTPENDNDDTNSDWPETITAKDELKDDHAAVIEAAIDNPDIASTGKLTEKAGLADEYNRYYAYDVLDRHWRERLDEILEKDNDEKYNTTNDNTVSNEQTTTGSTENNESEPVEETKTTRDSPENDYYPTSTSPNTNTETTQQSKNTAWKIMTAFIAGFAFAYQLLKNNED